MLMSKCYANVTHKRTTSALKRLVALVIACLKVNKQPVDEWVAIACSFLHSSINGTSPALFIGR